MGIVIDTFGELREKITIEEEDKLNTCMICGKKRDFFEKFNKDFEQHLKVDHLVWNYIYYIIYIKNKEVSSRNSYENYIYDCYEKEDYSWIPNDDFE